MRVLLVSCLFAASLTSQSATQFSPLTHLSLPVDHEQAYTIAYGDVDGDVDLVFGNKATANVLLLNDGKGKFTDGTAGRLPLDNDRTASIALVDVDGDKDLDIVFANYASQSRLLLNDGRDSSPT